MKQDEKPSLSQIRSSGEENTMAPGRGNTLIVNKTSPTTVNYTLTNRPLPTGFTRRSILLIEHLLRLLAGIWGILIAVIVLQQQWTIWKTSGRPATAVQQWNIDTPASPAATLTGGSRESREEIWRTSLYILSLPLTLISSSAGTESTIELPTAATAVYNTTTMVSLTLSSSSSSSNKALFTLTSIASITILLLISRYPRTTSESLLVLRTLGIQTSTAYTSFPLFTALLPSFTGVSLFSTTVTRFIPTSEIQDIFIHEAFRGWEVRYYLAVVVRGEAELLVVFEDLLPRLDIVAEVWKGLRDVLWEEGVGGRDGGKGSSGRRRRTMSAPLSEDEDISKMNTADEI